MTLLPQSPSPLPTALDSLLMQLASAWAGSEARPRISAEAVAHWETIIEQWIAARDLPLFVRRWGREEARGQIVKHSSGREVVPSDNSLAHWVFVSAFDNDRPTLADIRQLIERRELPVALALRASERVGCEFKGGKNLRASPRELGWRVCHKEPVGLRQPGRLAELPIGTLEAHFRRFLSPSNMFLVPKLLGGLGELPQMIAAMKDCE
jgi:hypothetical protein